MTDVAYLCGGLSSALQLAGAWDPPDYGETKPGWGVSTLESKKDKDKDKDKGA